MYRILTLLFILVSSFSVAQNTPPQVNRSTNSTIPIDFNLFMKNRFKLPVFKDTINAIISPDSLGLGIFTKDPPAVWYRDTVLTGGHKWTQFGSGAGGFDTIPAGPISSLATIGFNPGTNISPSEFIIKTFYDTKPPTAMLTGGQTLDLMPVGSNVNVTLNWSASRQDKTAPLATVVVGGINQSFSQPAAPGTVSGTQSVSVVRNANTTFSNVVTTTDGKSAIATTTIPWSPRRYYGWVTDTTGISSSSFNDAVITSLGNEQSSSRSKSFNTGNPTGNHFYVYAYIATAGALTQLDMNGFPSLEAWNVVTRNFTMATGYIGQWRVYWTKNPQSLSSTIVAN